MTDLIFFYFLLGIIPSIVWLLFYLRKDSHPESNEMILLVFFWGMTATLPVILLELGIDFFFGKMAFRNLWTLFLYTFLGIALVEEIFKYAVVRLQVLKKSAIDEPVDVMLYMIIAALGFAAVENILIFIRTGLVYPLHSVLVLSGIRFLGTTLLHALASATIGYFLALSILNPKSRVFSLVLGFFGATTLHGLYNFILWDVSKTGDLKLLLIPVGLILSFAIFVSLGFNKLKGLKSVCQIT